MIGIIDYGLSETCRAPSVLEALKIKYILSNDESALLNCNRIILPDTNDISKAIRNLHLSNVFTFLKVYRKPVLAISSGIKVLCLKESENGRSCLGVYPFIPQDLPIYASEQILTVKLEKDKSKILTSLPEESEFHFNRVYNFPCNDFSIGCIKQTACLDSSHRDISEKSISAIIAINNFYGIQFCPEKSGKNGLIFLQNFFEI